MTDQIIRVGVGAVCINKDGQVLLGLRKNAHGSATWGMPGGHVEFGETLEQCAIRETMEETGMVFENPEILATATHFFDGGAKHYVTILIAGCVTGEPQLLEPHKTEEWMFFDWDKLPEPMFIRYYDDIKSEDFYRYLNKYGILKKAA